MSMHNNQSLSRAINDSHRNFYRGNDNTSEAETGKKEKEKFQVQKMRLNMEDIDVYLRFTVFRELGFYADESQILEHVNRMYEYAPVTERVYIPKTVLAQLLRHTPSTKQMVRRLGEMGLKAGAIAELLGVNVANVYYHLSSKTATPPYVNPVIQALRGIAGEGNLKQFENLTF